jgi:hypothetical protein
MAEGLFAPLFLLFDQLKKKNMKQISLRIGKAFEQIIGFKLIIFVSMTALAVSCAKTGNPSASGNSSGSLLTKEVIVGKNHLNVTVDSIVTTYSYNANNKLTQTMQTMTSSASPITASTSLTYDFVYSGNLLSTINGTFVQSASGNSLTFSATTIISADFKSSSGKLTGYVQVTSTSGTPYLPITSITANDSAIFTYDASGNLATYNVYQQDPGIPGYSPSSMETFSYNGGLLSQTVNLMYVAGILEDTVTTAYAYNNSVSASPIYIAFGVPISVLNDFSQVSFTTSGINPNSVVSNYSTTYNSSNQPTSSTVTFTETPSNSGDLATENITYTYQ